MNDAPSTSIHIAVPPSPAAAYDVIVEPGVLERLPALLAERAPAASYAVISDANVARLYGTAVVERLQSAGLSARLFIHGVGDAAKTIESWSALADELLAARVGRDRRVVGLGGGVSGDLAGFAAATLQRGVAFVQVPTSLLAMVDASIGGKTGVNTKHGKNLVGAFLQPRLVAIDPQVLRTLPEQELRSGAAEMVKHGAIRDVRHLEQLRDDAAAVRQGHGAALHQLILASVAIKAAVVARDPLESGERAVLNFGHTVGHALELLTDYRLPHGYAVAIGMVAAAHAGEAASITEPGTARALRETLAALALPSSPPMPLSADALLAAAGTDKKGRRGRTRYVLLRRLGEVAQPPDGGWTFELSDDIVRQALAALRPAAAGQL